MQRIRRRQRRVNGDAQAGFEHSKEETKMITTKARKSRTPRQVAHDTSDVGTTPGRTTTFTQSTHWGELVQGPFRHRGRLITALITLPRRDLFSTAEFTPSPGELTVNPGWCTKAARAARLVLDRAGGLDRGGRLHIRTNIPLGCGSGSTTADVTATIRAVGKALRLRLTAGQVQRMDWTIERAADPLALLDVGRAVVYGSRSGETVRWLSRPLPPMRCLAFNTQPGETVLTEELASRTEYGPAEEAAFRDILHRASAAIESGCLRDLARAATDSARLNQGRLPTRHFDELIRMASGAGGAGVALSHSGTVGAVLFDPGLAELDHRIADLAGALRALGYGDVAPFTVDG
jgi:uncharacterized protein involved in propanediol utilization